MSQNSTKILFITTLITGLLITLCANSWLGAWMGLEINLLSFVPLMSSGSQNMLSNEASLKYFLIQAIASSSLLFLVLLKMNYQETLHQSIHNYNSWNSLLLTPLLLKIACAPFNWWLPSVVEGLSWLNSFLILSLQKIAPMILIFYLLNNNIFSQILIITSALSGAIGGLNQISLRKILSFSSINHIGWMLATMLSGSNIWILYISIYILNLLMITSMSSSTNLSFISQTLSSMNISKFMKMIMFTSMFSLGGLPPFLGFFPKWIAIQFMIQSQMIFTSLLLVVFSLLTLFYYLRIMYAALLILNSETFWSLSLHNQIMYAKSMGLGLMIIIFGIVAVTMFYTIF